MKPLIVIRPEPGCSHTVQSAQADGVTVHGVPMFAVEPVPWIPPAPEDFDALLIGSANALRQGGAALTAYAGKPAYVVGEATGAAAGDTGLRVAAVGNGGLQGVLPLLQPDHRRLLRLSGEERIAIAVPDGIEMVERIVYRVAELPMPQPLAARLAQPTVIVLHAASAARHFASECDRHRLDRSRLSLACIGPRVAQAAGEGWTKVRSAPQPQDKALLALALELCQ